MSSPKNFRKTPDFISHKLKTIAKKAIQVGCVKRVPESDIRSGNYQHLDISIGPNGLVMPKNVLPRADKGRFSWINVYGNEVVRRDLPKVTKTFSFETPNWGDWSNGSHDVTIDREVYQRDYDPPQENEFRVELLGKEPGPDPVYVIKFTISEVIDKKQKGFAEALLFNLNLLQENVGAVDVFPSDASVEDYLRSIYVDWEILPPGERENNVSRILANVGTDDPDIRRRVLERYDFFDSLKPKVLISGRGGFKRYFGGQFADNLVVFENIEYGNAVYAMFSDWQEHSKKTKQELLASGKEGKDFVRIPHTTNWQDRVKELVKRANKP